MTALLDFGIEERTIVRAAGFVIILRRLLIIRRIGVVWIVPVIEIGRSLLLGLSVFRRIVSIVGKNRVS